jgi:predicted nicotinamide N-methyase
MNHQTTLHTITLCNREIRLQEISNSDELFNRLIALGPDHEDVKDERTPYWAELWPSALALAQHILETNAIPVRASVLEIGCGLGLPGIAAGLTGASVIFTDYLQDALDFAQANWKLNNHSPATFTLLD